MQITFLLKSSVLIKVKIILFADKFMLKLNL